MIICQEMGWSWQELMETPAEVVDDVATLLRIRARVAKQRRKIEEAQGRS